MGQYIMRRLLLIPVLLLGITIIDYLFLELAPGDPVTAMIDPEMAVSMSQEDLDAVREALGLNKPVHVRYVIWLRELMTGNMGHSITRHLPVAGLIATGVKNTIALTGLSLILSTIAGVTFGIISALRQYSLSDYILTVLGFVGYVMK